MYLPVATLPAIMANEDLEEDALKLSPEVTSSTASSIYIKWSWEGLGPVYVRGFKVQYHRLASSFHQESGFLPPSADSYSIRNLVADTYYEVCVLLYRNDTSVPMKECVDAATTSWHIPVSIGSSIGAVLALSIIVLIVMLARCPNLVRTPRTAAAESSKYDSMSSHYPDDRYEMSDTTTHYHEHDRDEDMFSQHSEGDSLADSKTSRHSHHPSPQSLADRLCNGSRGINGIGKQMRAPGHRFERTLSLTDKRHPPSHNYRMRQARLAHLHANFHSIQSEPGSIPARSAPRVSITDFTPPNSSDLASSRKSHHSSMPVTHFSCSKGTPPPHIISCPYQKSYGRRDNSRLMYRIDSATSNSEPSMSASNRNEAGKSKTPGLKNLPKTMHMSIDVDALL
ncbi:unnamed protein product [Candidula unifasciata]|uniref:Fibronectin type-III domain-containing protein n=1 Tax=Candidula unifasciata TaxID=100452 RepID=A0A8S3ZLL5_9EUPU|nr:unnamed protein product [Candidula unifasciata]